MAKDMLDQKSGENRPQGAVQTEQEAQFFHTGNWSKWAMNRSSVSRISNTGEISISKN